MSNVKASSDYDSSLVRAKALCCALHGEDNAFGISYMKRNPDTNLIIEVKDHYGTFADHVPLLHKYGKAGWEPYVMVACTNGAGHSKKVVSHSWAVAADFDNGLPELFVNNVLIRPSFMISTSAGRAHAVWILDAAMPPQQMEFLADVIQDRFDSDAAFSRSNQMVRMPGFVNRKNGHKVKLHGNTSTPRPPYSYDLLCQAFDAPLVVNLQRKINHRYDEHLSIPRNLINSAAEMVEDAKNALPYIAGHADHYDSWIQIGLCLSALGEAGKDLFHKFSSQSAKYNRANTDEKWKSFKQHGGNSSIKPLFRAAQRAGWKNPGFRNNKSPSCSALTERQLGVMCAHEMQEDFAVIELKISNGKVLQFLKLVDGRYVALSDIEKRAEAEKVCKAVIAKLSSSDDTDVKKNLYRKIGTNKGMNDACDHIAEVLVQLHHGNRVQSFPYFSVGNGVLNLLTRELVPSRYRPLPTLTSSVHFSPTAKAPVFTRVLNEILEGDEEMVKFVLRILGYALIGRPIEQKFFIWLGPTAGNGKSTLLNAVKCILGPYFKFMTTASLMVKSHTSDGPNPTIAQLDGKRFAVVSEANDKQVLDASLVKQLTGDSHINVRDNYGQPWDMKIECALLMSTNSMPRVREDDRGFWRRAMVVPFTRSFSEDEMDHQLDQKLEKEASGILNMVLDGAHDYLENGLKPPSKIVDANQQRREEADPFLAFSADCLEKSSGSTCALKDIYVAYLTWHKQNQKFRLLTKPELSKRLEIEFTKRKSGNLPVFDGVDVSSI